MSAGGMHCRVSLAGHKTCVYARCEARQGAQMCHMLHSFWPLHGLSRFGSAIVRAAKARPLPLASSYLSYDKYNLDMLS